MHNMTSAEPIGTRSRRVGAAHRHVGSGNGPGDWQRQGGTEGRNAEPEQQRVPHGLEVAEFTIGLDIIPERELPFRRAEAHDDKLNDRINDQKCKDNADNGKRDVATVQQARANRRLWVNADRSYFCIDARFWAS